MKKFAPALFFSTLFILITLTKLSAQVGINTTTPRKTLEVNGSTQVSDEFAIGTFNPNTDADEHHFLIQKNSDRIKSMNVSSPTGVALGYIQEYVITNPNLDWVLNFDTGVDANDYVLIGISANYDKELNISTSNGAIDNASMPYTSTFVQNNTWRIIADYPMVANDPSGGVGTWTITTLIYSRDLSKQFGTINIPMSNASSGSAVLPVID